MPSHRREDLRNYNSVAEQNACAFGEDPKERKARLLRGEQAPKSSEELRREAAPAAGHYSLVGAEAYSK